MDRSSAAELLHTPRAEWNLDSTIGLALSFSSPFFLFHLKMQNDRLCVQRYEFKERGLRMPRIPEITERDQVPEDQRQHYDSIKASRNKIGAPYLYLLHCPDLAARTAHLVAYSLFASNFPQAQMELVICTVAREVDCVFEWAAHAGKARNAGVREEAIAAIRDGKAPEGLTDEEAPFVKYVQELMRPPHRISEPTFQAVRNRLGEARGAELTGIIGSYVALACTLNAFDVQTPEGSPVLPT